MIQANLIMIPAFNRGAFVHQAESVTGKNHLRATDSKNLQSDTAEVLSILEDFGGFGEAGNNIVHLGFLFAGTVDNIDILPGIVGGQFIKTLHVKSPILSAIIIVATLQQWETAIERVGRNDYGEHLKKCFHGIAGDLFKINKRTDLPRLL